MRSNKLSTPELIEHIHEELDEIESRFMVHEVNFYGKEFPSDGGNSRKEDGAETD